MINSPYYEEYIPDIMREIIAWEKPEGFTDNSWSGLGRDSICHCAHCKRRFNEISAKDLPRKPDWDDPVYRQWIDWSYQRRLELWDLNNRTTKAAGGPDCIWVGMVSGHVVSSAARFRDLKELCGRADMIMLDQQTRGSGGFQINGETGKRIHGLLGWDKLSPESMATYGPRKAARPIPEVRMWMVEGFAGTIQPWWHHVGAFQEDRRQFEVVEPIYRWYSANQDYLVNRQPVATVGVVWSQRNLDYYGRDNAIERAWAPYHGMTEALTRAFPVYPPETSWKRVPRTNVPALVLSSRNGARVAYMPADIDRRFDRGNSPDHGDLLANVVRWAAGDTIPLQVQGPGLIDCHMYQQPGRLILHLVNLTSAGAWRSPVHELIPVGPVTVGMRLPEGIRGQRIRLTVAEETLSPARRSGWVRFQVKSISDHEVAVME